GAATRRTAGPPRWPRVRGRWRSFPLRCNPRASCFWLDFARSPDSNLVFRPNLRIRSSIMGPCAPGHRTPRGEVRLPRRGEVRHMASMSTLELPERAEVQDGEVTPVDGAGAVALLGSWMAILGAIRLV